MLILAFDTSGKTASVALIRDDLILYDVLINSGLNHSEVLLPAIHQALAQTGIKITDIDLFACTIGPGSFTGLRIGASTMKGLILAAQKPVAGVSSLEALALNISPTPKKICALMDAGRGQVYIAYFKYEKNGLMERVDEDRVLNPSQIKIEVEEEEVIFVGDGAVKFADLLCRTHPPKAAIAPTAKQYIRASSVALLGRRKYQRNALVDASTFIPVYLRSHDAHVKKAS